MNHSYHTHDPARPDSAAHDAPACGAYDHRHGEPLPTDPEQLAEAAAMFQALSDPARLALLIDLAGGERCMSELVHTQQATLSSVTARLKVLHAARLVNRRRDTKHIYYSLADEHVLVLLRNMLAHSAEPF